ncbi:MAG: hypothetical protein J2P19_19020 [Pseudonocardia sp.]|nr:hypothetical protein [Pseudonocardia sp.]
MASNVPTRTAGVVRYGRALPRRGCGPLLGTAGLAADNLLAYAAAGATDVLVSLVGDDAEKARTLKLAGELAGSL